MKICEYIPTASFFVGGGEIYPLMQAKALADKGLDVTLVILKTDYLSEYFSEFKNKNPRIKYKFLESRAEEKNPFAKRELTHEVTHELYYSLGRAFIDLCEKEEFDVVVVHYGPGAIAVPKKCKEILFLHGTPSVIQPVNLAALSVVDKILAVSKSIVVGWHDLFGIDLDTEILYNAVDTEVYTPLSVEKDIDLLYVGRLIEIKGVQHLIEAVDLLNKKTIHASLTVAGKGPYEDALKELVEKKGLSGQVNFYGYVEENYKNTLYNRAKICVFPSFAKEGVLTTMLEAAACEAAIITANCCGMVDFINNDKNGLLFEPQDVQDLSIQIERLLSSDVDRSRLGKASRLDVLDQWSWGKHAEKFEQIIKELVK